jgi:signal transduction histidine kinase
MPPEDDKIDILKSSSLFKNLTRDQLKTIAPKFDARPFPAGTVLFDDGSQEVDGMYIIAKGVIKIYKNLPGDDARQQAIAVLTAGNFFGEMALLDEETRSAGAVVVEDAELLFLSKASFHETITTHLEVAHEILTRIAKVMSKRLRNTNNLFREVVSWGYRARKEVRDLKSNFLSTISHELRTPIHSIQGFSSLMKETPEADEATRQKFVDVIVEESARLGGLINDLISLAEMEYGAIVLERKTVHLAEMVEKVFDLLKPQAEEKKIRYQLLMPAQLPAVELDGNRLVQAVEHLISNAIKFTAYNGEISVEIAQLKNSIDIMVSDNGRGIPEKYTERVFDKFYQLDQSTTRSVGGAGIGLTLARHIVELHGGSISVMSKEGEGSTFKISLPKKHILPKEPH